MLWYARGGDSKFGRKKIKGGEEKRQACGMYACVEEGYILRRCSEPCLVTVLHTFNPENFACRTPLGLQFILARTGDNPSPK